MAPGDPEEREQQEPLLSKEKRSTVGRREVQPSLLSSILSASLCGQKRIEDYSDLRAQEVVLEIGKIRRRADIPFDKNDEEHQEYLKRLWKCKFQGSRDYPGHKHPDWRLLGFQADDCTTDFRAAGFLGLQMLVYFGEHHQSDFERITKEGQYPLAASAINVIEILVCHLKLRLPSPFTCPCCGTELGKMDKKHPRRYRPGMEAFAALVQEALDQRASAVLGGLNVALPELFSRALLILDQCWSKRIATDPGFDIMQFNKVFSDTSRQVQLLLRQRPSLSEVKTMEVREPDWTEWCCIDCCGLRVSSCD